MNYVADRLAEKTSGAVGDALGTGLGFLGIDPLSTVAGLFSPIETRRGVPEGKDDAVPVIHMDDTARGARRLAAGLSGSWTRAPTRTT